MVQMFRTCLDDTLEHLSVVEKHPVSNNLLIKIRGCQADFRFFRLFLWCFPDCDANLLADMNFVATSISELCKIHGTDTTTEYSSLATKVDDKFRKCLAEIKKYRQYLISCSLKVEPFTGNETMKFLDSVHVNINDLLKIVQDGFPTVKSQIESLEELVFLLRNLVYYTPMGGENYDDESFSFRKMLLLCFSLCDSDANPQTNLIFQFIVHDWANKAAGFLLLRWLIERGDEENGEQIRHLYIDLQQKVNPCNPEFIKLCFEVIKVTKMKPVDRLLFGEFVSRFVDFFLENLMLILKNDVRMVREGLILLITFLADPPANTVDHSELSSIREQIYAVLDQASDTICFFGETDMDLAKGNRILDDVLKSIDEVRGEIENLYVHIPHSLWSNFPRIDRLGYFECLLEYLENLKETMNKNKKLVPFLKHQIFTIREELLPLRLFLQDTSTMQNEHNGLKDIWEQIMSLLYQADFAIKSSFFIDDAIWYNLTRLSFVIRKIKDIRYKVMNIGQSPGPLPLMSSIDVPMPQTSTSIVEVVVGFKKEIELLLDRLECGSAQLDIVSIVGMGGIGKTTLAKKLYNEPSIKHHFRKRAFCSVSQVYRKRNVLLDILSDISLIDDEIRQMSDEDLPHRLYQRLKGFRYLIVVDDIWDISVWNDLRASFPDDCNGSRVIFTTRINSISKSTPCPLPFLSNDESWELLQQKIFHTDPCPPHLLKVGKSIAKKCKGLPLAIVVIAGLLVRKERSLLQWNELADTLSSFASSEVCNDIIKLSYKQLPEALKSCFLYLGAFPEDCILLARKLSLLWVAEGLVLKSGSRCLHKIAKEYLNDLGDRNLVTVTQRSCNGGIKSYRVHDLIRDFCRTEAQEEHYMCYINAHNNNFPISQYRICIEAEWRSFVDAKPRGSTVHSLLSFSGSLLTFSEAYFKENSLQSFLRNFKLVQVLDLLEITIVGEFPTTITTLVHLRYLALHFSVNLIVPPDISNLWNLETLVLWSGEFSRIRVSPIGDRMKNSGAPEPTFYVANLYKVIRFPNDIWMMKRLRRVEAAALVYVGLGGATGVFSQLPDLKTFKSLYIPPLGEGEELLRRLSNVRKFSCFCSGWWDPHRECSKLPKLEILTKLESLSMIHIGEPRPPFMFSFPSTIRKLTLQRFCLPWNEFSAIIGMLPCLEVLVLDEDSFSGKRWNVEDEEFPNIKSLKLKDVDIEEWNASIDSFPSMEKLVVSSCSKLIEIPPCFSEVATLKYITVHSCEKSVADSAIQIQKDQLDSGNESFEVDISLILE